LHEDLVDSCVPGDVVTISGEVKVVNVEESRGRASDKNKGIYLIYIMANSVENNKQVCTLLVQISELEAPNIICRRSILERAT